jgi:hypothetical protein
MGIVVELEGVVTAAGQHLNLKTHVGVEHNLVAVAGFHVGYGYVGGVHHHRVQQQLVQISVVRGTSLSLHGMGSIKKPKKARNRVYVRGMVCARCRS